MPSFQTIFRAVVMVAVGAVVVKGWHMYGPTNEQVKSVATQAMELVQSSLQSRKQAGANSEPDPRNSMTPQPAPVAVMPPAAPFAPTEPPKLLPESSASPAVLPVQAVPASASNTNSDRMPQLMARLQQMGAADTSLTPWGSGGQLYRFTCRAPLASAPTMTQHFECVAAEPESAVAQVVAKVEAWRVAQRDGGTLRY